MIRIGDNVNWPGTEALHSERAVDSKTLTLACGKSHVELGTSLDLGKAQRCLKPLSHSLLVF